VTATFQALWILCALGAVVFAAAAARPKGGLLAFGGGFVAAAIVLGPDRLPDAGVAAAFAAAAAALCLYTGRYVLAGSACGGWLAGTWLALLHAQGLPFALAAVAAATPSAVAVWLTRTRPAFAPDVIREEGLLAVLLLGTGVAILPGVLDGWQTAAVLNARMPGATAVTVPAWVVVVVAASMAMGAVSSLWSRR
jgi:hypothetical protein